METIVAAVVFGLIGVAVLAVLVYIFGMLLSGPVILVDQMLESMRHRGGHHRLHHHKPYVIHS